MGSIILDEPDFGEHVAELGFLHVKSDNRLPSVGNIVTKLIPRILRLVSSEEHDILANPQDTSIVYHAYATMGVSARRQAKPWLTATQLIHEPSFSDLPKLFLR